MANPKCRKCQIDMKEDKAFLNTLTIGTPDFRGNKMSTRGQTMFRGGPAALVPAWKCPKCGHSIAR